MDSTSVNVLIFSSSTVFFQMTLPLQKEFLQKDFLYKCMCFFSTNDGELNIFMHIVLFHLSMHSAWVWHQPWTLQDLFFSFELTYLYFTVESFPERVLFCPNERNIKVISFGGCLWISTFKDLLIFCEVVVKCRESFQLWFFFFSWCNPPFSHADTFSIRSPLFSLHVIASRHSNLESELIMPLPALNSGAELLNGDRTSSFHLRQHKERLRRRWLGEKV